MKKQHNDGYAMSMINDNFDFIINKRHSGIAADMGRIVGIQASFCVSLVHWTESFEHEVAYVKKVPSTAKHLPDLGGR